MGYYTPNTLGAMQVPQMNMSGINQAINSSVATIAGMRDERAREQVRQDALIQQDMANKRADAGLLLQQQAGQRAEEGLLLQKDEAARTVGKDKAAQIALEETNIAMADPKGYLARMKATQDADTEYQARLDSHSLDTTEGEDAFLAEPEVNSTKLLNRMSKANMGEVQKFLADREDAETTRKYQQGVLANSGASLSLQQKKFEDETAQRESNAQAVRGLFAIPTSQTKAEAAGVPKDYYLKAYEKTIEGMSPEIQAQVAPTQIVAMLEEAKRKDAANQEVVPVDIGKAAQTVLMGSKADVDTYGKIADIIQKGKPVVDEGDKLLAKVGLTKGSDEAGKFLEQYREKLTNIDYGKGKGKKSGEIDYLLKALEPLTANDDPTESNRKLIEIYPDLVEYAEKHNITFNRAVDLLKIETARNEGIVSIWDQDVERGAESLFGPNTYFFGKNY